ncbi:MAG: SDR family NAD(P)-dependent oxidoreductase [Bacteroidales bacterium]|nr:SDR family NAD(P)-dependent oxidoreductase [Bacteroidales bacterium]
MNYNGKTVWITGASSGIGAELARQFAEEGAKVIISSHEAEELEETRKQLEPVSKDIHTVVFNLGNPEEVRSTAKKVLKEFGRVDVLMNNGGISQRAEAIDTSLEIDRRIMEIDYFSGVILTKALLPKMIENGYGHIGVTSSISGKFGFPLRSAYAAAKHALFGFYKSVWAENSKKGIRITIFSPGRIRTNISFHALKKDGEAHGVMDPGLAGGISPAKCARKMIRAMKRNRKDVLIGGKELILVWIHKHCKPLYHWLVNRVSAT